MHAVVKDLRDDQILSLKWTDDTETFINESLATALSNEKYALK
jgi:hypothetical protein